MKLVLDANALIAIVHNEPGGRSVTRMIDNPSNTCFIHAVNLCEVYYDYMRTNGEQAAKQIITELIGTPLAVREDMDSDFWQLVGRYKVTVRRISLADCFCLALALRVGGELVTADHHEFDAVQQQGICPIKFIR
jgi:PIN domain nuclease of toxin-antitoxin system